MKLIESKVEFIPQEKGLKGIYKQIELAGRTAYQSQDKIGTGAQDFVNRMIKSKHYATLEHGTVYLKMPYDTIYDDNPYSNSLWDGQDMFVTTNYRVLQENEWLDDLKYLCDPTDQHEKRYTFRFTCSRAIAQELTRHRVFSFLMESQRYINYSKERHGGEITFIKPTWLNCTYEDIPMESELCYLARQYPTDEAAHRFIASLVESKYAYMTLLQKGCQPQQARDVLPNATKTELIMTGFASDWARLFELRLYETTGRVHPDMKLLMQKTLKEFEKYGLTRDLERYKRI